MSLPKKKGGQDGKKEVIHAKNQRSSQAKTFGAFHSGHCQSMFDWKGDSMSYVVKVNIDYHCCPEHEI